MRYIENANLTNPEKLRIPGTTLKYGISLDVKGKKLNVSNTLPKGIYVEMIEINKMITNPFFDILMCRKISIKKKNTAEKWIVVRSRISKISDITFNFLFWETRK